ncbi:nicotinate phosphoribosyltransferase [Marinobacter daqiaonensis]|uniref:Nicotinate phosphoribosyltransferase n=1 Tax=Marinobacter daqiaonensis TaxID=650891 RepID=A0A1I6HLU2_9GAMM|nr:nicotinate phosphoribosyltransferase [Marinobacter daqiaonensis]SFR55307.1 nicotinate phosphoribosyltransferase [Marinobacter daqiaonensis]
MKDQPLIPGEQDLSLMVDLYELAMAQAYWHAGMDRDAVFSLFFRKLPDHRNFVLACGQQHLARVIESLRFSDDHIKRLEELDQFSSGFLDWLRDFRFSGTVRAVPEGTPVFPQEPLLEVCAPVAEAQILESLVMNYVHLESTLASKAVRLVHAADGRPVVDFGMRRMHGLDSAWRGVRAYRLAGLAGTSNVLAGGDFGLPIKGTMAHSFIQACEDEMKAFRLYAELYPGTILLVDTYDTRTAVGNIIRWMKENPDVDIGGIRLDSGDLGEEARDCRAMLDEAGFKDIKVMASGGLDEYEIQELVASGAPIDGFGVGTAIGAAKDSPAIELAFKLTAYDGEPRMKKSTGKTSWPCPKQVFRRYDDTGRMAGDIITLEEETAEGDPLLKPLMENGALVEGAIAPLEDQVEHARRAFGSLPDRIQSLEEPDEPYPVSFSDRLTEAQKQTLSRIERIQEENRKK